jgi:membrane protein YdbS with pleckstrin-like domain
MNRAVLIICVVAVAVATFYSAALWGHWVATGVGIVLALAVGTVALVDHRRRQARGATPANRG